MTCKWLQTCVVYCARRPIVEVMGPPLVTVGSGLEQWGSQLLLLGHNFTTAAGLAFKAVAGPPLAVLLTVVQAVGHFMLPVWQVCLVSYQIALCL